MKASSFQLSRGFSLVEVTLALGVAAFCLLALFGLLPVGLDTNRISIEQTAAAGVASSVVADLRATPVVSAGVIPAATPGSPHFSIPIPIATSPLTSAGPQVYTLFLKADGSMAQKQGAVPQSTTNGWSADLTQSPRYRLTLVFTAPGSKQLTVTPVRVLVTWPATSDPTVATSVNATDNFPSRFSGSFETVTALKRH